MGRRYYCDYCNKSFLDDLQAREKHIKGFHHQKLRKQHYDSFRDPETILAEESAKEVCRRFINSGECPFGDGCKYTHFSPQDLDALRSFVAEEHRRKTVLPSVFQYEEPGPQLSTWLQKRSSLPMSTTQPGHGEEAFVWLPPPALLALPDLPPSLQPVTVRDFRGFQPQEWG